MAGNYGSGALFSSCRRHHVVMNDRHFVKLDQQIVSTEAGLAATIGFYPRGRSAEKCFS
jgi:hypothetical protein